MVVLGSLEDGIGEGIDVANVDLPVAVHVTAGTQSLLRVHEQCACHGDDKGENMGYLFSHLEPLNWKFSYYRNETDGLILQHDL